MKKISYDFSGLESAISKLLSSQDKYVLNEIRKELDKFFKGSGCREVIYTKNTDKLFFGMCTYAMLDDPMMDNIINSDEPIIIKEYSIEIDSKLLDIGLSTKEITAVMLHEIGHLVNDSTPVDEVRAAIDKYMADTKDQISLSDSYTFNRFLAFAIRDSLRKVTSIFTRKDEEIIADEFVFLCGYGESLESAYRKIVASCNQVNKNLSNKLLALDWSLRLYTNMKMYRLIALRTLNKSKSLTGSKLEQRSITTAIEDLKKVEDNLIRECYVVTEAIRVKGDITPIEESKKGLVNRLQHNGLKGIEEDVYEYQIRIRNLDSADDAILIMRQINTRMSVLDDFLMNSEDLPEKERARWEKCMDKYNILRDELSKKTIYNKRNYPAYFDYEYTNTENR